MTGLINKQRCPVGTPLETRLLSKALGDVGTRCLVWHGSRQTPEGYGIIVINRRAVLAHRAAYELWKGMVPPNHDLHHICENKGCINPDHLQPLTRRDHMRATPSWSGNRTHCAAGHELTGGRCRICKRVWENAQRAANRERRNAQARGYYAAKRGLT